MFLKLLKFIEKIFLFLLEIVLAILEGRRPKLQKGGKESIIIIILAFLGFFLFINLRSSSQCFFNCSQQNDENNNNILKSENFIPRKEATSSIEKNYKNLYLVTRVIDGDTLEIASGQIVRLIGIDAPEVSECYGDPATQFLKNLLENREISLEKDVSEMDKYKRLLRYVYLDDLFVNEYLVNEGYAKAENYPPDVKYQELFKLAETSAKKAKRGLWKTECVENYEKVKGKSDTNSNCIIKGNISWSGEKIYHLPGCPYYKQTTINETAGERYFCTEWEAIQAGWRKANNCP